jgi:hypothetical protein
MLPHIKRLDVHLINSESTSTGNPFETDVLTGERLGQPLGVVKEQDTSVQLLGQHQSFVVGHRKALTSRLL